MTQAEVLQTSRVGRLAQRLPFFYGWVIVYISFLGVFMMGSTSFWGVPVFVGPMHDDTGWSNAAIFAGLSVRFIVGAAGGLLLGHFADRRRGPQLLLLIGVTVDVLALASLRFVESPLAFILVYGVVGGAGNTGMRLMQSTLVAKWFVTRRGTAVSMSSNGGGVAALVMIPIISFLISELGWRDAWTALAAILAVLMLPCVPLAIRSPEDIGLEPDGGRRETADRPNARRRLSAADERSYRLSEIIGTWHFWLILFAALVGNYSLQTHTIVMVPYLEDTGFSSGAAASALSVYGLCSLSMRFFWGVVADRFSVRVAIILQASLTGLGALLLLQVSSTATMYIFIAYQGMMLSGYPPLQILLWPEFFGRMHIGSIVGLTQFFSTIAGAVGPVIAGFIFDQTGTYDSTLWMLLVTWLACAGLMSIIRPARQHSEVATAAT